MIIEICGPPGVGKTTLARALTARLHQRGLPAELASSYRPSERGVAHGPAWMGRGGIWDALHRLARPAQELLASSYLLSSSSREATTAKLILSSLPPKSAIWTFRFRQYIWRFSHVWFGASCQNRIVIFDQAFVQLVCSLVLLGAVVNDPVVSRVLALIPRPDLLVRLTAPPQILRARLAERQRRQSWIERRLEFDLCTNLRAIEVFERLQLLLGQHGWPTMCVDAAASQTDDKALARLESYVVDWLAARVEAA